MRTNDMTKRICEICKNKLLKQEKEVWVCEECKKHIRDKLDKMEDIKYDKPDKSGEVQGYFP
tara:strand:- start:883 stop:1068 length:186 start_codon:yes stop_codon:yes gene_type:complete